RHPRSQLDAWHAAFMDAKVRPMIGRRARALVATHRDAGALCAIVTATNSFVTAPIAREFGVAHLVATDAAIRAGNFTGKVAGLRDGKVTRIEQWLAGIGRSLASFPESWFYSDSHNDLALLERVTRPVAVDPDESLRRVAESRGWPVLSLR